tara:strand:- start:20 stop:871 length:852 start_codon:yes stop_codon:yes gene_type:complete
MISLLDTHQHFIYRKEANYSWTNDISVLANHDFTVQDYRKITKGHGIKGSLFMETGVDNEDYQKEAKFVKLLSNDLENNIKGLIVSIRPEIEKNFDEWLSNTIEMGVVGYRRILHIMPDDTSQSVTFRNNIRKIGSAGKTFDICYLASQLSIALDLAAACDNTILILNHCGVPNIAANGLDPWRKDIQELSRMQNVICKLSGLMAYCAPGTSSFETIQPYVDHVLNCFGSKRIVWGSDWPVVNLGKGLTEWINVTNQILSKLSQDESTDIANKNAQKFYKVKL